MKSLSPNAQEFIPIFHNNSLPVQPITNNPSAPVLISQQTNSLQYQQVLHNYGPQQHPYFNQQPPQIQSPPSSLANSSNSNQAVNMHPYGPLSISLSANPAHIPQYNQIFYDYSSAMNMPVNQHHQQNNFNSYSKSMQSNNFFQKFSLRSNHQRKKSGDSQLFNNKNQKKLSQPQNRPSTLLNSGTNSNSSSNFQRKISEFAGFEMNTSDKDWPRLNHDNAKSNDEILKETKVKRDKSESSDDESVEENETKNTEVIESYSVDQSTLKKLMQNVNFIKKTVEQHYLTEISDEKPQVFSWKEAVLKKPLKIEEPNVETVKSKDLKEFDSVPSEIQKPIESKSQKRATRRKRSRSKRLQAKQESELNELEKTYSESKSSQFFLNTQDFPDLDIVNNSADQRESFSQVLSTSKASTMNNSSVEDNDTKSNLQSDAYSSDATLEASLKAQSNSQISKTKSVSTSTSLSGKKLNTPIVVEFANIVSALEKGQKDEKRVNKKQHHTSGINLSNLPVKQQQSLKRSKSQTISSLKSANPLDSCPTGKRGKEREKPRAKKHSTLKKIILKEREEKRLLKKGVNPLASELVDEKFSALSIEQNVSEITNSQAIDNKESSFVEESENESECDGETSDEEDDIDEEEDVNNEGETNIEDDESKAETSTEFKHNDNDNRNEPEMLYLHDEDLKGNHALMSNHMSPISQGSPISMGGYTPTTVNTLDQLANNKVLISLEKLEKQVKQKIHNRKFREYCNQIINSEIDEVCYLLLHEIVRFQDRMYHKNPAKAKAKRRYVMGIREVTKHLKLKKLKCVILAPNCEKIQSKGGLDDAINTIIQSSMEQNVPFLFALGRKQLGKAVNKLVPISVVGIFDYAGAEEYFRRLVGLANNAKLAYQEMIEEYEKEECESFITQVGSKLHDEQPLNTVKPNTIILVPSHTGHSRTSSNGSNISVDPNLFHPHPAYHHSHSRSASGNFNFSNGNPKPGGHSRSASSGGGTTFNSMDLNVHTKPHWSHSRTQSNCSNISFISRLSEPISEVGSCGTLLVSGVNSSSQYNLVPYFVPNPGPGQAQQSNNNPGNLNNAVQYYSEQVRQEMRETYVDKSLEQNSEVLPPKLIQTTPEQSASINQSSQPPSANNHESLVNLHLGCITEIDQGNEADTEDNNQKLKQKVKSDSIDVPESFEQ